MSSQSSGDDFTVISTFSGCGGSSLGYKFAGGNVRLAVEWNDNAVATYELNFPGTPVFHGDIADFSVERTSELANVKPGELDILDGSPPCQGFSTVGKRIMGDARNQLFREYVRLLEGLQPKVFIMENVSGMVKGKMKLLFAEILRTLKGCGYKVSARLLNAMYFGVPQSRERVIFIGVREDLGIKPSHPRAQTRPRTVREALPHIREMIHDTSGSFSQGDVMNRPCPALTVGVDSLNAQHYKVRDVRHPAPPPLNDKYGKLWDRVPVGGDAADVIGTGFSSCLKIHPDKPAPTLPKTQTGHGFATVVHPHERRALTIEEAKVLSSFPAEFQLVGSYQEQWGLIGNSVPPLMMQAVAEHVRDEILSKSNNSKGMVV